MPRKCRFGVSYHSYGSAFVTGTLPLKNIWNLADAWTKFGKPTITFFPTLKASFKARSGFFTCCNVWFRITKSNDPSAYSESPVSMSCWKTLNPWATHRWIATSFSSTPWACTCFSFIRRAKSSPSPHPRSKTVASFVIHLRMILCSAFSLPCVIVHRHFERLKLYLGSVWLIGFLALFQEGTNHAHK